MINFSVHQVRAGTTGAREDFEQMLALLVRATEGDGNLVFANPGDWGIDVLVGDLHGRVTIWQAKYFVRGVDKSQERQIAKSFGSALRAASVNGYTVARWVLCIPSSMDGPAKQWWERWKRGQQRATGVIVELWDETRLRELLLQPTAAPVRRHYYNPYRRDGQDESEDARRAVRAAVAAAEPELGVWESGAEYRLARAVYLLHDGAAERPSPDRSWVWREATADRIEPGSGRVRLRQVQVRRRVAAAEEQRTGLRGQAELLARLAGRAGLPRLIEVHEDAQCTTVITAHPPGLPWAQLFGPGPAPLDRLTAAAAIGAAEGLCTSLGLLHRQGGVHRALRPDGIFADSGRRCLLRDIGLAAMPRSAGEGEAAYRAPEQMRAPYATDLRTDIYQLAAVVYHTLTGHASSPGTSPPVRAVLPGFPGELDHTLLRSLDLDPDRRPADTRVLASAFETGRRQLSRGAMR